jgi:hypothetical protein
MNLPGVSEQSKIIAAHLDSILASWHQWRQVSASKGWHRRALVCGDYQTSRQYDDSNGALDSDLEHRTMKTVDFQVCQMEDPHKAAIYANARALVCGVSVWTSPRLPADKEQREVIVTEARRQITRRLQVAGVL